jgi:soluble lytic murein transglycosylase-like protein
VTLRLIIAAAACLAPLAAHAADERLPDRRTLAQPGDGIPDQLDDAQRTGYRGVFASIRAERWIDAQLQLDSMRPGPLHAIARAQLYTAKNSPKVAPDALRTLLAEAPDLPHGEQLVRMAKARGVTELPFLPAAQRMIWFDAAPTRQRARSAKTDTAAMEVALAMQPLIKADLAVDAEALVTKWADQLSPESLTEWRQKVAWIYYQNGADSDARRVAALAQQGTGDWAVSADWLQGLAAWRQKDCAAAQTAFTTVSARAGDVELRSAGLYWASRADMACGRPELVQARLKSAAAYGETFYGLLARQTLGMVDGPPREGERFVTADWKMLERRPNVRVAAALTEIGETALADAVIRQQAKIGDASDYAALTRIAGRLNLPAAQLWMTHNCPAGAQPLAAARYPSPNWTPDGGWRVDKALVFAHTLQESRFNAEVMSPAGAYGLMQVMPAAATDIGRKRGVTIDRSQLTRPSTNMEVGQSYLEQLRDQPFTGGLLPKVIAAYNAGPTPVAAWNIGARDGGDPLLYIESIPYWETRGYVMVVLRNYWMYERQEGRESVSRAALAQGLWPKFPGLPGAKSVRVQASTSTSAPGGY